MVPVYSPASIGGVAFRVRTDEVEAGRRHAVHTIPNGGHVVEEFGAKPRNFRVTAYCAGPTAEAQAEALLALDGIAGPHLLVLPSSSAMVTLDSVRRTFDRDRLGLIEVELDCVDAGSVAAPGFGLAAGAGLTAAALDNLVFAAADALFDGLGAAASDLVAPVVAAASVPLEVLVGSAVDALIVIESVREAVAATALVEIAHGSDPAGLPSEDAAVRAAARATAASAFDGLGATLEASAVAAATLAEDPACWTTTAATALRAIADLAEPVAWAARARPLVGLTATTSPAVVTVATAREADAAALVPALVRVAALATLAEAAVRRDYADRPSAVAVRAALAEAVAAEIDRLSAITPQPFATIERLIALRDATVAALTRRATLLAPVVTVTAATPAPALVWAWRLYRDPVRAREIMERNGLDHPGFVPIRFEALAH